MKTPDEYLDEFWKGVPEAERVYSRVLITEAMKSFARAACKEQREICAGVAAYKHVVDEWGMNGHYTVNREEIKNAPEPTMI